eukprot:TRINITY_DN16815_c0_g1_i1.p1 TRINITY_DN16815_c0_g1~~TRINITY_DN16815_c0_g1_i1.p1  ORF type:complete len:341 (+),score=102.12 TRINITY_DN16815_c0_g1_i1:16-1038(+)
MSQNEEVFKNEMFKWALKNKIPLNRIQEKENIDNFLKSLTMEQMRLLSDNMVRDPLNLTEFLKKLRKLEKDYEKVDYNDLGYINYVCNTEQNMVIACKNNTHTILKTLYLKNQDPKVKHLAFWTLAEVNMHPENCKLLANEGYIEFFEEHLSEKYEEIYNYMSIKALTDCLQVVSTDKALTWLEKICPKFVAWKTANIYFSDSLDGEMKKFKPILEKQGLPPHSLRFISAVSSLVKHFSKQQKEKYFEILHKVPKKEWLTFHNTKDSYINGCSGVILNDLGFINDPKVYEEYALDSRVLEKQFVEEPEISKMRVCRKCKKEESIQVKIKLCSACKKVGPS